MVEIAAGLSTEPDARQAALEATLSARGSRVTDPPSVAVVFASPHHAGRAAALVDAVHEAASPKALIGCVGEAVLGGSREVEGDSAVAAWLGWFAADVEPYRLDYDDEGAAFLGWPQAEERDETHLMLGDPYTFPADRLLRGLRERPVRTRVIGGFASGGSRAGESRLFLGGRVLDSGAVGVRLPSDVRVETVVSQGCRPVGPAYTVTASDGVLVKELAGRSPLELVRELYASLEQPDRELVAGGLLLGVAIDEYKPSHERGDFLVRGVLGGERESGAIVVGDRVPVGATVRFHVRDAGSADEDLRQLLGTVSGAPAGALLFTCNGRGSRLFAEADHDAGLVAEQLGGPPVAGFFCAGELGPVGGRSFVHAYTASLALFYDDGPG